jgi:hypothetical protein
MSFVGSHVWEAVPPFHCAEYQYLLTRSYLTRVWPYLHPARVHFHAVNYVAPWAGWGGTAATISVIRRDATAIRQLRRLPTRPGTCEFLAVAPINETICEL